jgi:hypothetical protein
MIWVRSLVRTLGIIGLVTGLLSVGPAIADDDLDIRIRGLRCYIGEGGSAAGYLSLFRTQEESEFFGSQLLLARNTIDHEWKVIDTSSSAQESVSTPAIRSLRTAFENEPPTETVRAAVVGVDLGSARVATTSEGVDCEGVGNRNDIEVQVDAACVRTISSVRPYGLGSFVWLVNHTNQGASLTGRLQTTAELRGSGWRELDDRTLTWTLNPRSAVLLSDTDGIEGIARRVRVEVEIEATGRDDPIQRADDHDCPEG